MFSQDNNKPTNETVAQINFRTMLKLKSHTLANHWYYNNYEEEARCKVYKCKSFGV